MPLPSLVETNALGDDSISYFVGAAQEFVMKRNVGPFPNPGLVLLFSEVVTFIEVIDHIASAFDF